MSNTNNRLVIKIAGAAGQGIKTAGLIIARAIKRSGFFVFGYTEYPSLIRGGHNVYQIEVFDQENSSVSQETDVLLALDMPSITIHQDELTQGGAIIYDANTITLTPEQTSAINAKGVTLYPVKLLEVAKTAGGNALMKNTVALGVLWKLLGLDSKPLQDLLSETYNKSQEMIDMNIKCMQGGLDAITASGDFKMNLTPQDKFHDLMIVSGNEAVGMAAIAAGVRLYSSYPMTPASTLLTYIAEEGPKYGMVVKQAEDEITAANMVIGAYHGGTRAFCATSGGGFDLMTETLSLSGMTEIPFVCLIGQRPGPATGAPSWTAQGDLELAIHSGHGEFPRIVVAPGDAETAFFLTANAFNLAEKYQVPVLILSDKMLCESNYALPKFDLSKIIIDRGKIASSDGTEKLRYADSEDGVSERWFPGDDISTFLANSDEHTPKGASTEDADEIAVMTAKRIRKIATIKNALPDPVVYGDPATAKINIISWGSNKPTILAAMKTLEGEGIGCSFMQVEYLWPLKTEAIAKYLQGTGKTACFEVNATGQLSHLLKSETGIDISAKFLKSNGRPFFYEEVLADLRSLL